MVIFNNVVNVRNSNLARSYSTYHDFIKLAFTLCDDASGQVSVMFFLGFFFCKIDLNNICLFFKYKQTKF